MRPQSSVPRDTRCSADWKHNSRNCDIRTSRASCKLFNHIENQDLQQALSLYGAGYLTIEGTERENISATIPASAKYLHIAAVDKAGNISEITTIEIPSLKNLQVQKEWNDFDDLFGLRGTDIIFDVFPNNSGVSSGNCTAFSGSGYKCTINDLLVYDNNGNEIIYTVKERNKPNTYSSEDISLKLSEKTNARTAALYRQTHPGNAYSADFLSTIL